MSQSESALKSFFLSAMMQICESLRIWSMWAVMNSFSKLETSSRDINASTLEIRIL